MTINRGTGSRVERHGELTKEDKGTSRITGKTTITEKSKEETTKGQDRKSGVTSRDRMVQGTLATREDFSSHETEHFH